MKEKEHISILYNRVRSSHETRNLPKIDYERKDLETWLYANNYKIFFRKWKRSGFDKMAAPSLDRLDTLKGYSLDNLELVTWHENQKRAYRDRIAGIGRMSFDNEMVTQLSMTSEYIDEYVSVSEASRATGINRGNISSAADGKLKSAGGFIWVKTLSYNASLESDSVLF